MAALIFLRVWVGPHSARGLKPCSSAHEGMPGRSILSERLNYTETRDSCHRAEIFRSARRSFQSSELVKNIF